MDNKKELLRRKRHARIKLKMFGTASKPRLVVHRSLKNFYAQLIDDTEKKTIFSFSTLNKEIKKQFANCGNIKAAEIFGQVFAAKAKEKGFHKVIFDRAGYLYHGRIKAFAEALRKGGLEF
ncbi:MAG: 50S ribosomal protein L18 [Candidatus Omnitrophica bacterium]|nr:50S ribosomal protein L18 [Candidatus Omnitrophota bacterium]